MSSIKSGKSVAGGAAELMLDGDVRTATTSVIAFCVAIGRWY